MANNTSKNYTERRDAAENRQRILKAAIKLFNQYGVEKTSMNQIANEAKVGSGTLYRRYKNKNELSLALIKDNIDLLFENIHNYLENSSTDTPNQKLKEVLRLFINFRENKSLLLTGVEKASTINPLAAKLSSPLFSNIHQIFVSLFDEANVANHTQLDSTFRADLLLTALSHDYYSFQREIRHYTPEMILNQLYDLFLVD